MKIFVVVLSALYYFRGILCNYFSKMVENCEMMQNEKLVGEVIKDTSHHNAILYLKV